MTSRPPFAMHFHGSTGSNSQIAVLFSTAAMFIIWHMTLMLARLMTWPRHLEQIRGMGRMAKGQNLIHT
jgi:hypothetical protein